MMFFKNLSIRYKILIPVALLGCLMLALGIISLQSANQLMTASNEITEKYAKSIEQLDEIAISYQTLRRVAFAHIVEIDAASKQTLVEEADSLKTEIAELCNEYEKGFASEEEKQVFDQFQTHYTNYLEIYDRILEYSTNNQNNEASTLANEDLREAGMALTIELDQMVTVNKSGMEAAVLHQKNTYSRIKIGRAHV